MDRLMDILNDATLEYIGRQIEAGALRYSTIRYWPDCLKGKRFRKRVLEPTKALIEALKKEYPACPLSAFCAARGLRTTKSFAT